MEFTFYKYHGTGNDFILIDGFKYEGIQSKLTEEYIKAMCDRHFGIGADGLMILKASEDYDFEMIYYNSDGRTSSMCGNGGRCIVTLAHKLGYISNETVFLAIDGVHQASIDPTNVSLKMIDIDHYERENQDIIIDTGSPHYIKFVEHFDQFDILAEARKIRYNNRFKSEGINVNFVKFKDDILEIRTYERGVEDETLSCGTGVVASSLACIINQFTEISPIQVKAVGGNLQVAYKRKGKGFSDIYLIGPSEEVFEGIYRI